MRTPASDSVTRSGEDGGVLIVVDGVGATGSPSGRATTNAASGVTASGLVPGDASPASFLRHRLKVLMASPCSRQKRRAPRPLVLHVMTISRQNAAPCRGRRSRVGIAVPPVASSVASLRRYDGNTFAPHLRAFKTGCADGYGATRKARSTRSTGVSRTGRERCRILRDLCSSGRPRHVVGSWST